MLVSLFVFVVIVVLALPASIVLIPFTLVTRNVTPLYAVGCFITRLGIRAGGIRIVFAGREHIPAHRACIFMANHVSNLDAPAFIANLPGRTSVFLKRSLMRIPILGFAFKLAGFIPVDRDGQVETAQLAVADGRCVLESGLPITTFVEGKRSTNGQMLPFKKGPFYLAMESGALCIPVSIYGTERILPWGSMRIHPGVAQIVFQAPIDPANFATRDELSDAVRASIASGLPEWMRS